MATTTFGRKKPDWLTQDGQLGRTTEQDQDTMEHRDSPMQQEPGTMAADTTPDVPPAPQEIGQQEAARAMGILEKYRMGKSNLDNRIIHEEQWYKLRHWQEINKEMPEGTPKPTSAWLFNSIMNKHADAMDNMPEPNVLPREPGDQEDAKALSEILPTVLERCGFEQTYSDAWWDKLKTGTAVYSVVWDTTAENGLGDIAIRQVDVLNCFWEPGVRDIQQSPHFFVTELVDNEALDKAYPEYAGHLRSPASEYKQYIHDDTIDVSDKSLVVDWYTREQDPGSGRTVLHYAKLVGNTVLYATKNDPERRESGWYDHGEYPFVFDVLFPEKDMPTGFGFISICMDPQMYIDTLSGYMLEHAEQKAHQRWWNYEQSAVNEEEFLDRRNRIVHVQGSITDDHLKPIDVPTMGGEPINILQMKIDEMKETSANKDFSSGGVMGGVTAASAISALQESGNKVGRDINAASYRSYTDVNYLGIELIRQFYDETRCFRITGSTGQPEFVSYSNAGIKDQALGMGADGNPLVRKPIFDIKIKPQKKNPFSTASANERAKELYQLGFFSPDRAQESLIALDMMEFEGIEQIRQKVQEGQTLMNMVQQMGQQMDQMATVIQAITGKDMGVGGNGQSSAGQAGQSGAQQQSTGGTGVNAKAAQAQSAQKPIQDRLAQKTGKVTANG